MLQLSHTYISTTVMNSQRSLLVLGSVLPDIASLSKGMINREKLHDAPDRLHDFVTNECPSILDFALGVRLHSSIGRGADYYSDDREVGFAVIEGEKLVNEVRELLGVDYEVGLVRAHNFIEAGVDLNLKDSYPEILDVYRASLKEMGNDRLIGCLSGYLGLERAEFISECKKFAQLFSVRNLSSLERMAKNVVGPVLERYSKKSVDNDKARRILMRAKDITKDSYKGFLDDAVRGMKIDFALYL